ncbi:MAG: hypothetical protein ACQERF_03860 [Actinomycetota bacterium]
MSDTALFDAGLALGRARILAIRSEGTTTVSPASVTDLLQRAALHLRQAGREVAAARAAQAAATPTNKVVEATRKAIQGDIAEPPIHALNAGIQLGWAIETCYGMQRQDVDHVVGNLEMCGKHLTSLGVNAAIANRLVESVRSPIVNLNSSLFPRPRELPQHKPRVEKLATDLRALLER